MKKKILTRDLIFYILMLAYPVIQFCIFYIGVNFKSILFSFQRIDVFNNTRTFTFDNIRDSFNLLTLDKTMIETEKMSLRVYFISLITGVPLGLLFSFYIFKKRFVSNAFRVLLFLPSIVSSIIMVTIFRFFTNEALLEIMKKFFGRVIEEGLVSNPKTSFRTVMFYNIFVSFGTSVLMYSNRMSAIDTEMVEAAHLDGAVGFKEFWYIILPHTFSTLSTFLIVGIAGIFSNQFNLFSFFGKEAPDKLRTFGYYLYVQTANAKSEADYPILSSLGFLLSIVAIALTFTVRWLLNKIEPSEE